MKITFSREEIKRIIAVRAESMFKAMEGLAEVECDYQLPSSITVNIFDYPEEAEAKRLVEGEE